MVIGYYIISETAIDMYSSFRSYYYWLTRYSGNVRSSCVLSSYSYISIMADPGGRPANTPVKEKEICGKDFELPSVRICNNK